MSITDRQREILEKRDWRIHECEDGSYELETWSPAGEDLIYTIRPDEDVALAIYNYWADFDIDEHVEPLVPIREKKGVPSSISALVRDAEEINDMLYFLWIALKDLKD